MFIELLNINYSQLHDILMLKLEERSANALKVEKRRDLVYLTASENASDTMEADGQQRMFGRPPGCSAGR